MTALQPRDVRIEAAKPRTGPEPGTVRITFLTAGVGGRTTSHLATCRFGPGLSASRTELVALTHDGVPLTGASLYLLNRFYLDAPDPDWD